MVLMSNSLMAMGVAEEGGLFGYHRVPLYTLPPAPDPILPSMCTRSYLICGICGSFNIPFSDTIGFLITSGIFVC